MRGGVARQQKWRDAEQLLELRKGGKAVLGEEADCPGACDGPHEWEVIERFIERQRRIERKEKKGESAQRNRRAAGELPAVQPADRRRHGCAQRNGGEYP